MVIKVLKKLKHLYDRLKKIDVVKFIHYNYFSKNIIRDKDIYFIPYKNVVLDLHPSSRIYIHGKNLEIGANKLRKSKSETHLRMKKNAVWNSNNGCGIFYNIVLEIDENAVFDSKFFTINGGSVIICAKHISFGEDVMLGRNIVIYDSDYHQVLNDEGNIKNFPKEVIIGDHVWLTNQITVLKGVTIGAGTLVSPYTVIRKDLPEYSMVVSSNSSKVISNNVHWSRDGLTDIG